MSWRTGSRTERRRRSRSWRARAPALRRARSRRSRQTGEGGIGVGRIEEAKLQRHAVRPYDDRELANSDTKKATPVSGGRYHFRLQASLSGLDERDRQKRSPNLQSTESDLSAVPPSVEGVIDRLGTPRVVYEA